MKVIYLKYMFGYQKISKVDNRLSRGSAVFTPVRAARLKLNGVEQIIDLRGGEKAGSSFVKALEKFYCRLFKIKYVNIPLSFTKKSIPSENSFKNVVSTLNENNLKTFIHCHYGRHRTGECVALYQKSKNQNDTKIINDLLDNGWNKKKDFAENSYQSLLLFLQKYFPNKKNLDTVEKYRSRFS